MKKRVRQTDVARLAGVSPATVSLVINNRIGGNVRISEETRQRVLAAVDELGYVVDPAARSLAGGHNFLLGVFTFESIFPLQSRDFYYRFLVGIEEEAEAVGYDLLLFTSSKGADGRRHIYNGGINRLRMADGSVLLGSDVDRLELQRLRQEGYIFVFIGRREIDEGELAYVAADYAAATAEVVQQIFRLGHTRINYIGQAQVNESQVDRRRGYQQAYQAAGKPFDPATMSFYDRATPFNPPTLLAWLDAGVTAFVLETGPLVQEFVRVANAVGKRPPADFSLALLGDPLDDDTMFPDVTMFKIPRRDMGAAAVRLLAEMLDAGGAVRQVTLPCRFIAGRTVAAPPVPVASSS